MIDDAHLAATSSASTSTALPPPQRPSSRNRRRASQPASLYTHVTRAHTPPSPTLNDWSDDGAGPSSSSSSTAVSDIDSDDDLMRWSDAGNAKGKRRALEPQHPAAASLEWLDLSLSLPLTVAVVRGRLLTYLNALEEQARAIAGKLQRDARGDQSSSSSEASSSASSSVSVADSYLSPFYTQLEALKDDLHRLTLLFPSAPLALPSPSATLSLSSAAIISRSQSLAADWDRISSALSQRMPGFPASFPSVDPRSVNLPRPAMPLVAATVLQKVQGRFDDLQELLATMTLRDCWEQSGAAAARWPSSVSAAAASTRRRASISSAAAHLPSWDSIMSSIKESSERSKVKAGEMVTTVLEAEHAMYKRACGLANEGSRLIHYADLPHLWRNNEHILSGYRFIPLENWGTLLRSTFQLHNETVNIHSHLFGVLIVLPLFWPSKGLDEHTTWADRLVQTIYLVAAMKCLVSSVVWHVFSGCSNAKWFERAACVDYSGVALLVAASVWTTIYNEFYCQPNLAMLYSCTTLVVGLIGAAVPWASWFNERSNKGLRIVVFLGMCFTSLLPFAHATYEHGLLKTLRFLSPILPSLACYIIGLVFYATNWPESRWPGKFDLFLHAHQIWHVSIVLAILFHYRAALQFHANRFEFSCTYNPLASGSPAGQGTMAAMSSAGSALLDAGASSLLQAAGGLHGVEGLQRADEKVHGWRIVAGRLGGGRVGLVWGAAREWLQRW
ncbi:HlyIII-domain-containing protein [Jaminaea rosea]|uniref:HlyIII-domain-containing protein n=1 Tax=Jaminaea rosea TaxID=1569628 RepID=A0A316UQQ9_9BASI|nr:HlyIII-domain-containing protein [Jaminaea rosea]PWN27630.1 HlyIII-domain-containing protein [Jaminaea rosea]